MNKALIQLQRQLPLFGQMLRFGIIGVLAATIHLLTVIFLVQKFALLPLSANVFGFALGFQMSYWGHRLWTFRGTRTLHRTAFLKLLTVQLLCFAANEGLFYVFLTFNLPYPVALTIVLIILPLFTFASSKLWVFSY